MEVVLQAILFLGIIPALILMFISLKGYDGCYRDKSVFLTFVAGIATGCFAAIIEFVTVNIGITFIILFPIFEQIFKTMILNLPRLHRKKEATIYGLSLGLGFGSIFTPFAMIAANFQTGDMMVIAAVVVGSVGIIMVHGATGTLIGYGVYATQLKKYFILALLFHIPVTLWFFVTNYFDVPYLQIGLILYGVVIYWYATTKVMPQILSQSNRRKKLKK
jgi:hypothetical protein